MNAGAAKTRRRAAPAGRCFLSGVLAALTVLTPAAALAADAARGEQIAKRWCAACHIASSDQTHGADNVPPFATIASKPGFEADKIARFLTDPHPRMPDMQLTRAEASDLGAYIASLAK